MTPAWPCTIGEDFDVVERRMQEEKPTRYLCIHCEKSVDIIEGVLFEHDEGPDGLYYWDVEGAEGCVCAQSTPLMDSLQRIGKGKKVRITIEVVE